MMMMMTTITVEDWEKEEEINIILFVLVACCMCLSIIIICFLLCMHLMHYYCGEGKLASVGRFVCVCCNELQCKVLSSSPWQLLVWYGNEPSQCLCVVR